jgi:hypothetical protein
MINDPVPIGIRGDGGLLVRGPSAR